VKEALFQKEDTYFQDAGRGRPRGIFVILVIYGFAWEFSEYLIDIIYHTTYNFGLVDSITDFSGDIIGVLIVIYLGHRSIETIPPGEYLDYLLLEHTPSSRSVKYEALPIPDNPDFFKF